METILRTIVEADRTARAEADAARKRREDLSLELSECKKQIDARYRRDAEAAIARARTETAQKTAQVAADLQTRTEQLRESLQSLYAEKQAQWVEHIVHAVIDA